MIERNGPLSHLVQIASDRVCKMDYIWEMNYIACTEELETQFSSHNFSVAVGIVPPVQSPPPEPENTLSTLPVPAAVDPDCTTQTEPILHLLHQP